MGCLLFLCYGVIVLFRHGLHGKTQILLTQLTQIKLQINYLQLPDK